MLTALDGGAGVARAAASVGLAEQTVRSWIRRGRENPEGRFAPFAIAADRMRRVRVVTVDPNAPLPDRGELLRRSDAQSRAGSTRATELLLRAVPAAPEPLAADENWRRLMIVPNRDPSQRPARPLRQPRSSGSHARCCVTPAAVVPAA